MMLNIAATARAPATRGAARQWPRAYCTPPTPDAMTQRYNRMVSHERAVKADIEKKEKMGMAKKWGESFDMTMPKDPKAAKGTVLEQIVRENKRAARLPDEEYVMLAREKHPAMPDMPKPSGEWFLGESKVNEVAAGSDLISGKLDSTRSLQQAQNDARMVKRREQSNQMEALALSKIQDGQQFDVNMLDKGTKANIEQRSEANPLLKAKRDEYVHPSLDMPELKRRAEVKTVRPSFPIDNFPPLPDDIPPQRKMTDAEWEMTHKAEEERDRTTQRIYDEAFQKWKLQKKVENQRAGRKVLEHRDEDEEAAKRRREAAEELKSKEAVEVDPLDELEREMFPERFEEEKKEADDLEEKKARAQINLKPMPNALTLEMQKNIIARGSMPLAEFMKEANLHPQYGYYVAKKKVFGRDGDFITSPEISIMFGECVCAWALDTWEKLGRPSEFHLVEIGGGKGTLLARVLKTAMVSYPDFYEAARVGMVEVSPTLVAAQKDTIEKECGAATLEKIEWADDVEALDVHDTRAPMIVYCNELFDVFAVSKFQYTERGWCEWLVEVDEDPEVPEHFKFVLSSAETGASVMYIPHDVRQEAREKRQLGRTLELQMQGYVYLERVLNLIAKKKGVFLAVDYGHDAYVEDSLRGIRGHEFVHPLSNPGEVDLSAMVSFKMLQGVVARNEKLAAKIHVTRPMNQGEFLRRTGIEARLAYHMTKIERARDSSKLAREFTKLVDEEDSDGMGHRFKVMAFSTKDQALIPPCPWLPVKKNH